MSNLFLIWVLYKSFLVIKATSLHDLEQYNRNVKSQQPLEYPLTDNEI